MLVTQYTGTVQMGAFYEIVGSSWDTGSVVMSTQVPYIAGHRYYFYVHYMDRYHWGFLVNDLDNGNLLDVVVYNPGAGGTQYNQPIAYFVSERLSYGDLMTQYMNHANVRFRTAAAHISGGSDQSLVSQRPEVVTMFSPTLNYTVLSYVDALESTSSFTEHWNACGVER
jgi:hypothetical protein